MNDHIDRTEFRAILLFAVDLFLAFRSDVVIRQRSTDGQIDCETEVKKMSERLRRDLTLTHTSELGQGPSWNELTLVSSQSGSESIQRKNMWLLKYSIPAENAAQKCVNCARRGGVNLH